MAQRAEARANEWVAHRINVNAIAPGYMQTDLTSVLKADETRNRQILERIPAGRWGRPEDLAGAAVFLASHAAQFGLHEKYKPGDAYNPERFVDPRGYHAAVEKLEKTYQDQLAKERAAK